MNSKQRKNSDSSKEEDLLRERLLQAVELAIHILTCNRADCTSCVESARFFLDEAEVFAQHYAYKKKSEHDTLLLLANGYYKTLEAAQQAAKKILNKP